MEKVYTMEEKYLLIKNELLKCKETNPIKIAESFFDCDYINMHGPEHHFLDGASFMTALHNVGLDFDLSNALDKLANRTIKMPGAMCGYWGVCGSVTSLAAVLSIIHEVGPLTNNSYYKDDMEFTARVISKMSKIGGPRCCKRNAYLSISNATVYVKEKYNIDLPVSKIECENSKNNKDCLKDKCPFYRG